MRREEALRRLKALKPWLESQGVTRLRVFGSVARDEAGPDSDLDLLVDFDPVPGLRFFGLEKELSRRLGVKVELVMEGGMNRVVKARALADALDAL
jgi:predicted nucleotidyltransferase